MALHGIYTVVYPSDREFIDKFKQSFFYERYIYDIVDSPEISYIEKGVLVIEIVPVYDGDDDYYSTYELYFSFKDRINEVTDYVFNASTFIDQEDFLEEVNNLDEFMTYNNEINVC